MTVKIAIGNNNTAGLVALSPQPALPKIGTFAKTTYGLNGSLGLQGSYIELVFADSITEANWFSVFAQCGLSFKSSTFYKLVTLQLPNDEDSSYTNFNGMARYLGASNREFRMWKNGSLAVVNLVAI